MAALKSKTGLTLHGGSRGAGVSDGDESLGWVERVDYEDKYYVVRVPFRCFKAKPEPDTGDK